MGMPGCVSTQTQNFQTSGCAINVCAVLLSRDSRNEGGLSLGEGETCGIVKREDVSAIEIDWNLGGVYLDNRIEHWLVRIAKWRAKSMDGRKAKMAVCAAYLDSGEGRHDLTRLMFKSACDEWDTRSGAQAACLSISFRIGRYFLGRRRAPAPGQCGAGPPTASGRL
jgi:hypothetical protein